ncbi:MAG: hypothetical protein U0271_39835 [Polyangiaceae bacterium]
MLTADALNTAFSTLDSRMTAAEATGAKNTDDITAVTAGRPGRSAFRAYTNSQVLVPSGESNVKFDAEAFDAGNEYDPATGEFVTTTGGIYDLNCNLIFDSGQSTSRYYLEAGIFVNGDGGGAGRTDVAAGLGDGYAQTYGVHALLELAPGDTVTCGAYQNSGAPMKLQFKPPNEASSSFSAVRLSL